MVPKFPGSRILSQIIVKGKASFPGFFLSTDGVSKIPENIFKNTIFSVQGGTREMERKQLPAATLKCFTHEDKKTVTYSEEQTGTVFLYPQWLKHHWYNYSRLFYFCNQTQLVGGMCLTAKIK